MNMPSLILEDLSLLINSLMLKHLDWISVLLYIALVSIGWVCIYATGYNEQTTNLMDFSQHATKQLFFVCTSVLLILFILGIERKF